MTESGRTAIPAAEMSALVADGRATRLLPEFEIVPTRYAGQWWQVAADDDTGQYVPVPAELGASYDQWHSNVSALDALAETYEAQATNEMGPRD